MDSLGDEKSVSSRGTVNSSHNWYKTGEIQMNEWRRCG